MPSTVPSGLRLELSRSRIIAGKDGEFGEWMEMLNDRYDESLAAISAERSVFEELPRTCRFLSPGQGTGLGRIGAQIHADTRPYPRGNDDVGPHRNSITGRGVGP